MVCLTAYGIARRLSAAESGQAGDRARRGLAWVDSWVDWALPRGLMIALGVACVWLLAAWVPHYLTWPLSRDEDTFAVLAMSWDHGILPYRDIRAYNFPGETYLFWMLGKVFGWGRIVPFYAVDAGCVVLLGGVLVGWSRKTLGGILPGLIGYLAFLSFYLNQLFEITGERDWHTAFLMTVGIMILQAVRTRSVAAVGIRADDRDGPVNSAACRAVPARDACGGHRTRGFPRDAAGRGRIRNALTWSLWLALFSAMAFAPLFLAGIADDFVRGLRVASYGGPYNKATRVDALREFIDQFRYVRLDVPLVVTFLLAASPKHRLSRMSRTWCLAWLGALVYRSIHPVLHLYLIHPVLLVASITWAFPVYCLLSTRRLARPVLVLAMLMLTYEILPAYPYMCSLSDSFYALRFFALGKVPPRSPLGSMKPFPRSALKVDCTWSVGPLLCAARLPPADHQPADDGRQCAEPVPLFDSQRPDRSPFALLGRVGSLLDGLGEDRRRPRIRRCPGTRRGFGGRMVPARNQRGAEYAVRKSPCGDSEVL